MRRRRLLSAKCKQQLYNKLTAKQTSISTHWYTVTLLIILCYRFFIFKVIKMNREFQLISNQKQCIRLSLLSITAYGSYKLVCPLNCSIYMYIIYSTCYATLLNRFPYKYHINHPVHWTYYIENHYIVGRKRLTPIGKWRAQAFILFSLVRLESNLLLLLFNTTSLAPSSSSTLFLRLNWELKKCA